MTSNSSESGQTMMLARQPIFDRKTTIVAYELLFRNLSTDSADVIDGDSATSQVLLDAFTHLNINDVIGNKKAYINFTRNLIGQPLPFDKSRLVIEVLEDIVFDDEFVQTITDLSAAGYTIALDDFVLVEGAERILPLVDIVKLDVLLLNQEELVDHVNKLKPYNLTLLAEKVETHEVYEFCKDLGFELFQGYFLSKPQLISAKKVPPGKMVVLQLISKLQNPDCEIEELEQLISLDPVLGFKVLQLVNSAMYSSVSKIDSLSRAITYLGLNQIRSLTTLLALSSLSDKPNALKISTMVRAKMCELVGTQIGRQHTTTFFSLGLLSTLDAYFDQPLESLLNGFSLNEELTAALLSFTGTSGQVLQAVIALEQARWDDIDWTFLATHKISPEFFNEAYQTSIIWQASSALD